MSQLNGAVRVLASNAFCISDPKGDVYGRAEEGLFYRDTRHLSKLVLRVNGDSPELLSSESSEDYAGFYMTAPANGAPNGLSVMRHRTLEGGVREELRATNHTREPVQVSLELEVDADFADLFEVKGRPAERAGELVREDAGGGLRFVYRREGFRRSTRIGLEVAGGEVELDSGRVGARLSLEPKQTATVLVTVTPEAGGVPAAAPAEPRPAGTPVLRSDWEMLERTWEQSLADLRALSFRLDGEPGLLLAAGLPWFMALFGRDTLIAAFQTVHLGSELAKDTLRALARRQATDFDDFRDAEPGKILHELRFGELAHFGEVPHSPYYGTVDATPLFLVLLHEVWRWTADEEFARELEGPARRALEWIQHHADTDGDGYADYRMRSSRGLHNQGWKDSDNSVLYADGTQAEPPIALCEAQGYIYDALMRSAELAERVWQDAGLARRLRDSAADLQSRFDRDFWVEGRGGYYALALDGAGRKVDSVTSNMGHLLWSGIVPEERSRAVADRLMEEAMFSGWGVRTMSEEDGGYNPVEYHNGTVWPHDNSLIAYGLYRYGYRAEANRISTALVESARYFDYRLPEVFAGYRREETRFPVEYPSTCSPQGWAAGTPPLLVRAMLGLEPDPESRKLVLDPKLPDAVSTLHLENVPAFGELRTVGV
jgi:glycogen debranching enzyme